MVKRKYSQQRRGHTHSGKKKAQKAEGAKAVQTSYCAVTKNPAVKYTFKVLCSIVICYFIYWSMSGHPAIQALYNGQATLAGGLLSKVGRPNKIIDNTIVSQSESSNFKLTVAQGCEALDTVFIILIALFFYPGLGWKSKMLGAAGGILLTQSLNIIRIASLYLIGIYKPSYFELAHYNVWPMLLIIWIVCFWWFWLKWSAPPD